MSNSPETFYNDTCDHIGSVRKGGFDVSVGLANGGGGMFVTTVEKVSDDGFYWVF